MSILQCIKGVFGITNNREDRTDVLKAFGINNIEENIVLRNKIDECNAIYQCNPAWLQRNLKTMNFGNMICSELARLATLEIDISNKNGNELVREYIDIIINNVRSELENAIANGAVMMKPNAHGIDFIIYKDYIITSFDNNGYPDSCVFLDKLRKGKDYYIRAEYHCFNENGIYTVENIAFKSDKNWEIGREVNIETIPEWEDITPYLQLPKVDKPLFSYLKMPSSNFIDQSSKVGLPVFAHCIQQLEDIDVAYTMFANENEDSEKKIIVSQNAINYAKQNQVTIPRYIQSLDLGIDGDNIIHEHNPVLQTETRKSGLNFLISMCGYQCGFSPGYFSFNEKTGIMTATQIEADQQRTMQTVADIRDELKRAIDDLFYAVKEYLSSFGEGTNFEYELTYYFKDITASFEEDRVRAFKLVNSKLIPKWYYLVNYEGFSEEEAKTLIAECEQMDEEQEEKSIVNEK